MRIVFSIILLVWASAVSAAQVTVFAAASLKPALDPIAADFEAETGHRVRVSYAATSLLARQIEQGAPADVFLSANTAWSDVLFGADLIDAPISFAGNRLVVVGKDIAPFDPSRLSNWQDRLGTGRVAIGFPQAVPVGIYAREALENLEIWDDLQSQTVPTDNARSTLVLAERGEVPLAIVYASDATSSQQVSVVARFDAALHAPIIYQAGTVKRGDDHGFIGFLASATAQTHLRAAGFEAAP